MDVASVCEQVYSSQVAMRRSLLWVVVLLCSWGCGGETSDNRPPPPAPRDQKDRPVEPGDCGDPGDRRDATADEAASYCICLESGHWVCYGPDPLAEPAGGSNGSPPAACMEGFKQQPSPDSLSCLWSWTSCSDGHDYMLRCFDGSCHCLIDGTSRTELEPGESCPADLETMNAACGWALTRSSP